jgi:hypothetical protein
MIKVFSTPVFSTFLLSPLIATCTRARLLLGALALSVSSLSLAASPQITGIPELSATVGTVYTYDLRATDADNDPLHYSLSTWPAGLGASISAQGVITWSLDTHHDAGQYTIDAHVYDDHQGVDRIRYTLTVTDPNNHAPVINTPPVLDATVGTTYTYDLQATDGDNDLLSYKVSTWPIVDVTISDQGVITWPVDAHHDAGQYAIFVRVDDGNLGVDKFTYWLTVTDPNNHAPVINNPPVLEASVGTTYTYDLQATDGDNDPLRYKVSTWPSGVEVSISDQGVITWEVDAHQDAGQYVIIASVDDDNLGVDKRTYWLTVTDPNNHAPVINNTPGLEASVGTTYTYDLQASDGDNDPLSYKVSTWPSVDVTISGQGVITWNIGTQQSVGPYVIFASVDDSNLGRDEQRYTLNIVASDTDGDTIADSVDNCPSIANTDQLDTDNDGVGNVCDSTPNGDDAVVASINPSRDTCASPCTVVFSAENTTAQGLDEHGVWSQLSYHWDFDTDESDTYGYLYNQTYTYVDGDTAFEKGHVPLVTKTFLCDQGVCVYNVGMRAQNAAGDFDDTYHTIIVNSESTQWSAADTVCISNTLSTSADWTGYDKPCPAGAIKQNVTLDYDQYNGKLVLFKKGDVFIQNIATVPNQSHFKLGVFGDVDDLRPEIDGEISVGMTNFGGPKNAPTASNYLKLDNAKFASFGSTWPSNVYVEGLKIGAFNFPMSYAQIGLHDIDMDRRAYATGGRIDVAGNATRCHSTADLSCSNVPFPKGGYISSVNIVGESLSSSGGPGVNIVQTACPMVNFLGITDTSVQRAREHNLRIAGWYRLNIMRSIFHGEHELNNKQKVTPRTCLKSGGKWEGGVWSSAPELPSTYLDDVEGRTRADAEATAFPVELGGYEFAHGSRYQVVAYNQIGDADAQQGTLIGGTQYQTNAKFGDESMWEDIMLSHNVFENEPTRTSDSNAAIQSYYGTCVDNTYAAPGQGCYIHSQGFSVGERINPVPITPPLAPASL